LSFSLSVQSFATHSLSADDSIGIRLTVVSAECVLSTVSLFPENCFHLKYCRADDELEGNIKVGEFVNILWYHHLALD
jgi:hypothetical protein